MAGDEAAAAFGRRLLHLAWEVERLFQQADDCDSPRMETLRRFLLNALVELPRDPFLYRHAQLLHPLIRAWWESCFADALENTESGWSLRHISPVLLQCADIAGGVRWRPLAEKLLPEMLFAYQEI